MPDFLKNSALMTLMMASLFLVNAVFPVYAKSADGKAKAQKMTIAGYIERVTIYPEDITVDARMDTGATSSSLNALDQERFKRDGADWVRFKIIDPDDKNKKITFEREIVRNVRILRHDGNHHLRPVVSMGFCIGSHYRQEDVTLQDRSKLTYQLLVGRKHMRDAVLVDSSSKHLLDPKCSKQ